jgi:beta-lactamase regulating signal transducer with metallopeptidase domain
MWTRLAQSLTDVANRPVSQFWVDATLKATILLLATIGATALLRRQSAALRHRLWCLTFAALVMLPGLSAALPQWRLAVLPYSSPLAPREESRTPRREATVVEHDPGAEGLAARDGLPLAEREDDYTLPDDAQRRVLPTIAPAAPRFRLNLITLWLGGALLAVSPLAVGLARTLLLHRKARAIDDASWIGLLEELRGRLRLARRVELIETEAAVMPMTWGLRRPVVLLPRQAREWPDRLRRIVLLHELAHIKRCDVAFQTLGRLACALYWFHPLAWYALRRLRIERELACDDCVVHTGERATDYAAGLLQVARSYRPIRFAAAVAMAQRSNLEHRLFALFDRARSHLPLSARGARLLLAGVLALVTTLAVVRVTRRADAGDETSQSPPASDKIIVVRGRVSDPDGKPFAGATVYAVGYYYSPELKRLPLCESKSDAEGRFELSYPNPKYTPAAQLGQMSGASQVIAAVADGFGSGFASTDAHSDKDLTLRLVRDDVPIAGRVLDLEGRPVAGVRVSVHEVKSSNGDDLRAWLEAIARGEVNWAAGRHLEAMLPEYEPPRATPVVTDGSGHYRVTGIGRERVATLLFTGPKIAYTELEVVTRRMAPIQMLTRAFDKQTRPVYGADLDLTALPTQPIVGAVRDAETGKPLAGVTIANNNWLPGVVGNRLVRTTTDEAGRYRLAGLPKMSGIELLAIPNDDQPFFMQEATVPNSPTLDPITLNFDLHRGIWITGRVTDKATQMPVPARVRYFPFLTNEYAQRRSPEFGTDVTPKMVHGATYSERYTTRPDGTYRLVGLPGRALVGAECVSHPYRYGVGAETIVGGPDDYGRFPTYHNNLPPTVKWPNSVKEINPPADAESATCDLQLDPGESMHVAVVDPDGKALVGYRLDGDLPMHSSAEPRKGPSFDVLCLGANETRTVVIRHEQRKLGKVIKLQLEEQAKRSLDLKLEPCATVKGRLLNADGDVIVGATVTASVHPNEDFAKQLPPVTTDDNGRFQLFDVPTGCTYDLGTEAAGMYGSVARDLPLGPGESKDLGDVTVGGDKKVDKKQAAPSASNKEQPATPLAGANDSQIITLRGRVLDPDGKPLAGAKLYLSYANQDARKLRLLGAAGDDGRFQFEADNAELDESLAPDPRARVNIAAVAEGFGLQWLDLDQRDDNGEYTLRLVDDVPIRGRIVDVDGQGIAAAKLRLRQIAVPAKGLDGYIEATRNGSVFSFDRTRDSLPGTPDEITLDPDGRFTLRGVGAERVVEILVEGPNIEWWYIKVMSRKTDAVPVGYGVPGTPVLPRPDRVYGAEFGHVAPPSRLIVGTLRDADSGKPIAGVKVQSRGLYSSMHVPKTDVEGRFELMGHPKAPQYELLAVPDGLPYFESSAKIQDTAGLEPLSVEMALLRGTEAHGRMTFEPDGQPGSGTVEYHPLRPNPDAVKIVPRAVARPLATATIGTDGRYRLPVLPGPGVLAFRAHGLRRLLYAPAYVGRDELQTFFHDGQDHGDERVLQTESGRPGPAPIFQTNYNRLILINPPRGAELLETDVTIESGRTAKGIVYDPDDQPLAGAMASGLGGRQGIGDVRLDKPAFTVAAMHPRRTRELVFRHPDKRWGKFLIVPGDQVDVLHVRLERCGEAEGRLLDTEGMPVAHASISVSRHQHSPTLTVETDDRGIFRIDNLVPGLKYDLNLLKPAQQRGQPGAIQTEIVVVAGERKALGDVGVKARQAIPSKAAEK